MSEIRIRAATPADLPQMVEVIDTAYAAERARLQGIPDVAGGLDMHIRDDLVRIAERQGEIYGMIVLVRQETALLIANLAVAASAQGQGIGALLMQAAEAEARALGYGQLVLRTHAGMAGTRRFYAAQNWVEVEHTGQVVHMQKLL